jgi:opine dehydrogenase
VQLAVGVAGTGSIGFACAAWLAHAGHRVTVWSPGGQGAEALRSAPLRATGLLEAEVKVAVASSAAELARAADVLILALPVNGHRGVMERLLPDLRNEQTVIVSSMASLSSLYLRESALARGIDLTVTSLGTTALTARRSGPAEVRVMARRSEPGISALPAARSGVVLALAHALFGSPFVAEANALASALGNVNPVSHGPLALFNWTRIERAEHWPQYHYLTPAVARVIERLDAERIALARAFGIEVRPIEAHLVKSFGATPGPLADIAAELHAKRGGPPGPTDTATRFLGEDVPYGLAFSLALGRIAGVPMPGTATVVEAASLVLGRDLAAENDLVGPLRLSEATLPGLLARVA